MHDCIYSSTLIDLYVKRILNIMAIYKLKKSQVGLLFNNSTYKKTITKPGTHMSLSGQVFVVDRNEIIPHSDLNVQELKSLKEKKLAIECVVPTGYKGVLFVDGAYEKVLDSGRLVYDYR